MKGHVTAQRSGQAPRGAATWAPTRVPERVAVRGVLHGPRLQAKLTVSAPDDPFEREADRVADEVMRMPDPAVGAVGHTPSAAPPVMQRMCAACAEGEPLQRTCSRCEEEGSRSGGAALDADLRGPLERH